MAKTGRATKRAKRTETRVDLPEARTIDLPPRDYQPTKAEKEETFDMPGADAKTIRSAFFRPIHVRAQKP